MRELDFIDWIRGQGKFDPSLVSVGPGDDAAVVLCGGEQLLVTVDQVLDGVHFRLSEHGPEAAGRKAMARNLSDIAAMAGLPLAAVASAAFPKGFSRADAEGVYRGLRATGDEFDCPLVGGDVGAWDGRLAISVTVVGRPSGIRPVLRSGARVGDAICVTGSLGGAWQSRRHLEFVPRIHEARALALNYDPHAMIDLSDGLAADLRHVCEESRVGADVLAGAVPIHPQVAAACGGSQPEVKAPTGGSRMPAPLRSALGDGEDYELLFTLSSGQAERLVKEQPLPVLVSRVGTIVQGEELTLVYADAYRETMKVHGWEHET